MSKEQLALELLALPSGDRADFALRLLESLDEGRDDDPGEVEAAWLAESQRRLEEIESGKVLCRDGEEVFREI